MDSWRSVYLGTRELPQMLSGFELQAFFSFDASSSKSGVIGSMIPLGLATTRSFPFRDREPGGAPMAFQVRHTALRRPVWQLLALALSALRTEWEQNPRLA
jgi:hypothetical protein